MIPEHLKYTPTHEWLLIDNKSITIGITKYLVDKLEKLLYLDIPKAGEEILSGICFGEIESLGMLLDITSPVSGKVIAANERLIENLDLLSKDPYKKGWLIKFVALEPCPDDELMNAEEYAKHLTKLHPPSTKKRRKPRPKIVKGKRKR
jgi:glycine cleavage system H protein